METMIAQEAKNTFLKLAKNTLEKCLMSPTISELGTLPDYLISQQIETYLKKEKIITGNESGASCKY